MNEITTSNASHSPRNDMEILTNINNHCSIKNILLEEKWN